MDMNRLKKFAQGARRYLLGAVAEKLEGVLTAGSAARRESPAGVRELEEQLARFGREAVIDAAAYMWFNRFCALRYMDVTDCNPIRILSPLPGHIQPEILEEAKGGNIDESIVTQPKRLERIRGLLSGAITSFDPQTEAYKLLLVSACNAYYRQMPFLFPKIEDYTELLMPDDLMSPGSILTQIREAMTPETAERGVEIIGWLYQFYISERKDEVMGKTVATADIPAATQLFTPDWIVRYLVENTLGRLWMLNHPESRLAESMEYYIAPTEQDVDFLRLASPEEIRFCDPCCGSGHILTNAFDLLVKIYQECGYPAREIPTLILSKNLYGVEIDPRAGELAAFALTMKGREYDARFLRRSSAPKPNICVLENAVFTSEELDDYLTRLPSDFDVSGLRPTLRAFENAKFAGSLIRPALTDPAALADKLAALSSNASFALTDKTHYKIDFVLRQADYLAPKYHAVVTNPPYMGTSGMNAELKKFAKKNYPASDKDLFAMFIERNLDLAQPQGTVGMITMQSWMFLSSFETLRARLLDNDTILTMAHLGPRAFDSIGGEVVQTTAFTLSNTHIPNYQGAFLRLVEGNNECEKMNLFKENLKK